MPHDVTFDISLRMLANSEQARALIAATTKTLQQQVPVFESLDSVGFNVDDSIQYDAQWMTSNSSLLDHLQQILAQPRAAAVIIVSDELIVPGSGQPSDVARRIRELFLEDESVRRGHLCGLVGIGDGGVARVTDIDRVVGAGQPAAAVRTAVNKAADGLWLKSPRRSQVAFEDRDAVRVHVVHSKAQLRECFQLRHQVYDLMGYLPESISSTPAGIEIDLFDLDSIHFVASDHVSGDVIGTMRLVLQSVPPLLRDSIVGQPARVFAQHRQWCREIAKDVAEDTFRELLQRLMVLPLPILENSDFGQRWPEFLDTNRTQLGGEISRVVVAPHYQGLGVSRLLMRTGIAAAFDLQKHFLLLECIPAHVKMYQKYGFQPLAGHHCRAQGLDQIAVGMRLDLDDSPFNQAVGLAKRDMEMIHLGRPDRHQLFGSKVICLCNNTMCWKDGAYAARGAVQCPLREVHAVPASGAPAPR